MYTYHHGPVIEYKREENIMQVQDFFGEDNGMLLKYEEKENEYYVLSKNLDLDVKLKTGDVIEKTENGYVVWEEKAWKKHADK